jgi:hypothetical protein
MAKKRLIIVCLKQPTSIMHRLKVSATLVGYSYL